MTVIAWIVEGTWPACVDAARTQAPAGAELVLLHVTSPDVPGAVRGAYAGLLGRGRRDRDPGARLEDLGAASAQQLLRAAARRLGRPCVQVERTGRVEREVVAAADGADLLILDPTSAGSHESQVSATPTTAKAPAVRREGTMKSS